MFMDSWTCIMSAYHNCNGGFISVVHSPEIKWLLNLCIVCSATFILWLCGYTNWNSMLSSSKNSWTAFSSTNDYSLPFLSGMPKIAFVLQSYTQKCVSLNCRIRQGTELMYQHIFCNLSDCNGWWNRTNDCFN